MVYGWDLLGLLWLSFLYSRYLRTLESSYNGLSLRYAKVQKNQEWGQLLCYPSEIILGFVYVEIAKIAAKGKLANTKK